ncbi:hypothetical protein EUGRSUZ_C02523 [Eucalyptus grandis]|uniref:DUF4220 domain-containing protein n=2 Tax=Eucalyptus grandis TaxID=71139 RepID=A0A059CRP8_EUCGR|nr:hypothetical protein EUGRSUZ_C02523 [Eucalyptus grandis]
MTSILARFVTWAAYLLLTYVATIALGKLTVVHIDNPENPGNSAVLKGLLAPLLLMQLGYPDSITAYAVEDNRLGLRQTGKIGAKVGLGIWILIRCWDDSSPVSRLYFPLSVVAIMNSALWVWALQLVYGENSSVDSWHISEAAVKDVYEEAKQVLNALPNDKKFDSAKFILNAYFSFKRLKPHLVNWPYLPLFISFKTSIDSYPPDHSFTVAEIKQDDFTMTEIQLNFIFDMLYTKAAFLYTKLGLIGLLISFFCSVSALCGFTMIFKSTFMIDKYITYTYALLMVVTSFELHQIMTLAFSDWAVVKMSMNLEAPLVLRLLPFLAERCMKQRRWSRSMGQLNLLDHRLFGWPKPVIEVLDWFEKREIFSRYWLHSHQAIPSSLKVLVVQKMAELEKQRHLLPFTKRGEWTLRIYGIPEEDELIDSFRMDFDESIIIWHLATEILYLTERKGSTACGGSKLLSAYMMYLLAVFPSLLSVPAAHITLDKTCSLLRHPDYKNAIIMLSSSNQDGPQPVEPSEVTRITCDWHVLLDVQKLVVNLRRMDNKWEIISNIWVEMLCYAAYNCQQHDHAKLLRKGGELITHVWLLLGVSHDRQLRYGVPETSLLFP